MPVSAACDAHRLRGSGHNPVLNTSSYGEHLSVLAKLGCHDARSHGRDLAAILGQRP